MIVTDEMRKNKSIRKLTSREEKIEFIRNWKDKNELLLQVSSLLNVTSNLRDVKLFNLNHSFTITIIFTELIAIV